MNYLPLAAALVGALVGSALTASLAHLTASRRELRQARMDVLMVLMSGRSGISDAEVAKSLNIIPVLFHDKTAVRRAYQHLCAAPSRPTIDLYRRYNEVTLAVAASLGFADLTAADMDLGFYPSPAVMAPPAVTNTQPVADPEPRVS